MEEQTTPQVQAFQKPKRRWLKVGLLIVGSLALLGLSAYAGYWYGKKQITRIPPEKEKQPSTFAPLTQPIPPPEGEAADEAVDWKAYEGRENVDFYDFEGVLTLSGYLKVEGRRCAWVEDETCKVSYASFVVTRFNHPALFKWLDKLEGNAFVGESSIGLGCYESDKERIYSVNDADIGKTENIISGNALERLLASDSNDQVALQVTRAKLFGGTGAPDCYSHFRDFKVL